MLKIKIEKVGSVDFLYPYLEVFCLDSSQPFLDVGITDEKTLNFKFYSNLNDVNLSVNDLEYILNTAKDFLPKVIKDEEDFLKYFPDNV